MCVCVYIYIYIYIKKILSIMANMEHRILIISVSYSVSDTQDYYF